MPTQKKDPLAGTWEKTTQSPCSQAYPDRITFQEKGLYTGEKDPPGTFSTWDVGKYTLIDAQRVKISTASDEIVTYEFSISGDVVTFIDPDGCKFGFRRSIP